MAVPDLSQSGVAMAQLRNEREESAKQRAHERDQALKEFGYSLGKSLATTVFQTAGQIGTDAFSDSLEKPERLAKEGMYVPDVPEDDTMAPARGFMNILNPRGAPGDVAPAAQPFASPLAAPKPKLGASVPKGMVKDAGGNLVPLEPDVEPLPEGALAAPKPADAKRLGLGVETPTLPLGAGPSPMPGADYRPQGRDRVIPMTQEEKDAGFEPAEIKLVPPGTPGAKPLRPPGPPSSAPPQGDAPQGSGLSIRDALRGIAETRVGGPRGPTPAPALSLEDQIRARKAKLDAKVAKLSPQEQALYNRSVQQQESLGAQTDLNKAQAEKLRAEVSPEALALEKKLREAQAEAARASASNSASAQRAREFKLDNIKVRYLGSPTEAESAKQLWNAQQQRIVDNNNDTASGSVTAGGSNPYAPRGGSSSTRSLPVRYGLVTDSEGWAHIISPNIDDGKYYAIENHYQVMDDRVVLTGSTRHEFAPPSKGADQWTPIGKVKLDATGQPLKASGPVDETVEDPTSRPPRPGTKPGTSGGDKPETSSTGVIVAPVDPMGLPFVPESTKLEMQIKILQKQPQTKEVQKKLEILNSGKNTAGSKAHALEKERVAAIAAAKKQKEEGAKSEARAKLDNLTIGLKQGKSKATLEALVGEGKPIRKSGDEYLYQGVQVKGGVLDKLLQGSPLENAEEAPLREVAKSKRLDPEAFLKGLKSTVNSTKVEAEKDYYRKNLSTIRKEYKDAGLPDGRFYQWLEGSGVSVPAEYRPPGVEAQASPLDDLFDKINAMPWSADRKRRVFQDAAKKKGLA